ncbi:MAG: hypothetical protein FJ358_05090 [Thaumarchaeota archaeon]|nr:hypothetical protein [Nitrososphaerota archaeon]
MIQKILAVFMAFALATPLLDANAQLSQGLEISLENNPYVGDLGSISMNETFSVYNPTESAISLPSLTLNLPSEYDQKILDVIVSGPTDFSHAVLREGNFVKLTITPRSSFQVPTSANVSVKATIATSMLVDMFEFGKYRAFLPVFPTSDAFLKKVTTNLVIARGTTFSNFTAGLSRGNYQDFEAAVGVKGNVTSNDALADYIYFEPRPDIILFSIADFSSVTRTIRVSADGKVIVRDSFKVTNKGVSAITSLRIFPAYTTNNVTIIENRDPPLRVPLVLNLINDRIDMLSAYGQPVQYLEEKIIHYEYVVKATTDGSSLSVKMPAKSPVSSVIRNLAIKVEAPQNYKLLEGQNPAVLSIVTPLGTGSLQYKLRPSASWASSNIFPIATGLFVITLLSLAGYSMRSKEKASEAGENLLALVKAYEEKVSIIGSVIGELKAADIDKLQRGKFDGMKKDIALIRSKAGQRAVDEKKIITQKMPEMQKVLNDISNIDASLERVVQQYLQAYEQHLAKRTTREVFRSATSKLEKEINGKTSELLAMLAKTYSKEGLVAE